MKYRYHIYATVSDDIKIKEEVLNIAGAEGWRVISIMYASGIWEYTMEKELS